MSSFLVYISTHTTADPYIPPYETDVRMLSRGVSDALTALSGGRQDVGEFKFFPLQRTVPGFLLCDGKEVPKADFQELYGYLGNTEGTPVDPLNFVLPNFVAAASFVPAATAATETVTQGTVENTVPTNPDVPDYDFWVEYVDTADSGGRPHQVDF